MNFKSFLKVLYCLCSGVCLYLIFFGSLKAQSGEGLYVFAAASLTDALQEVSREFQNIENERVFLNFAGSNTLRLQIEQGLPCDIFISADVLNVDRLVKDGLVSASEVQKLLGNALVVITQPENPLDIHSLEDMVAFESGYLSLADPQTVPAGLYAKEALVNAGVWAALERSVAPALDARATMAQVENGNAAAGIVYRTDAVSSGRVRMSYQIPPQFHSDIIYPICIIKGSAHHNLAQRFVEFLQSDQMKNVFRKYGFEVL